MVSNRRFIVYYFKRYCMSISVIFILVDKMLTKILAFSVGLNIFVQTNSSPYGNYQKISLNQTRWRR